MTIKVIPQKRHNTYLYHTNPSKGPNTRSFKKARLSYSNYSSTLSTADDRVPFLLLPEDMLLLISQFFSAKELATNFSLVCRQTYSLSHENVHEVNIRRSKKNPITRRLLEGLKKKKLEKINVSGCKDTSEVLSALEASRSTLTSLTISDCSISKKSGQQFQGFKALKSVKVSNTKIQDFSQLFNAPRLSSFTFQGSTMFTDKSLESLRTSKFAEKIGYLSSLNSETVTDAGVISISQMKTLTRVILIGLKKLTDRGVIRLSTLPKLQTLDISRRSLYKDKINPSDYNVTNKGIRALVNCPMLQNLLLKGCLGLSNRIFETIAFQFESLEKLDLSYTHINDQTLLDLSYMPKLKILVLKHCIGITSEGIKLAFPIGSILIDVEGCPKVNQRLEHVYGEAYYRNEQERTS